MNLKISEELRGWSYKNLQHGNVDGKDGITLETLKLADGIIGDNLLEVLKKIWLEINLPSEWTEGLLTLEHEKWRLEIL